MKRIVFLRTALIAVAVLAMAGLVFGQAGSGNIYGRVTTEDGSSLPGVSVTLSGVGPTVTTATDNRGEFHFLNLAPESRYMLKFEISGFATVERKDVAVNLGVNTNVRVAMKLAAVEATVTVTGEAPLLDTRKVGTGATVTRAEMDMIPTARDPWVVMQTVPGVQVDRINVGGNQSGQQSIFVAKGASSSQGAWILDGVNVSDVASGASSPTYWDFDSFQELQAVTGGSDPSIATAGVTLNMVTKRGTNEVHGSGRVFITDEAWQASPQFNTEKRAQRDAGAAGANFLGNKIKGIQDYGLDVGGPVLRDRIWLWGAYGRQQIDQQSVSGFPDNTTLEDVNGKLNVQVLESNALTGFYLRGDKRKQGRNASIQRPPETTFNQSGPTALYKVEDNHVFSSSLVADVQYSYLDEGFQLVAQGGPDAQVFRDSNRVFHNSFSSSFFKRPQHQVLGTLNYFFGTGNLGHEIKFGAGYRSAPVQNAAIWPGGGIIAFQGDRRSVGGGPGSGACRIAGVGVDCVAITRQSLRRVEAKFTNFYLSDTITADRLTVTAGFRYDYSTEDIQKSTVPASPLYPNILPAASAPELKNVITWKDVSPRLGATYAIGPQRRTLARFSYARYANQLGAFPGNQLSAIPGVAFAYYKWNDANNNNRVDPGEIDFAGGLIKPPINFSPANPSAPVSPHGIDPDLKAEKTDEIVVGFDHELFPNFAVGAAYTYRHYKDFYYSVRFDRASGRKLTPADYIPDPRAPIRTGTLPDGTPWSVPVYTIRGGDLDGDFYTNRPNYTQRFHGVELTLNKRLSNKWMARASFAYNDPRQSVGPGACVDPTNTEYSSGDDFVPGGCEDGGLVAPNAGGGSGSFGFVNLNSKWQFNLTGAYQLPLGFTVAGNFFGRQGYPIAYYTREGTADGNVKNVYVTAVDKFRYGSVTQLDLRLEKNIPITSAISATLAAEMFNVFNTNTVLQRNAELGLDSKSSGTNTIFETQSPRIVRFSGRLSF